MGETGPSAMNRAGPVATVLYSLFAQINGTET